VKDRKITQCYASIEIDGDCDSKFLGEGPGDFDWQLGHKRPGASVSTLVGGESSVSNRQVDTSGTVTLSADTSSSYIASFGGVFELGGWMQEIDSNGADATLSWAPENCIGCDFIRKPSEAQRNDTRLTVDAMLPAETLISWTGSGACFNFPTLHYTWTVNARIEVE